jgi:small subunit ribosomal protein S17
MAGRVQEGLVTSSKMTKTLVVLVSRKYKAAVTGKIVSSRKKYKVHCEDATVKTGDRVSFVECRPISKDKKFRLLKVLSRSDVVAGSTLDDSRG